METPVDVSALEKGEAYAAVAQQITAVLEGIDDDIAAMATISSLLHHAFGYLWTGFYRLVSPGLLRVGPYQGSLGCLEITLGKGVCGTAAAERRILIVPDVDAFPGHIRCDARSRSEIVVPVLGSDGALLGVLDIDSDKPGMFDEVDARALSHVVQYFSRKSKT